MQEIFPCPKCGAQNVVGQEFCQNCRQRFQYNCPFCGVSVNSALVNCPSCRQPLYWPTPHKVKAFPKRPPAQQSQQAHQAYQGQHELAGGYQAEGPVRVETAGAARKKGDLWLIGCLGLVILGLLAFGVYFVYNNFIKEKAPSESVPSTEDSGTSLPPGEFGEIARL